MTTNIKWFPPPGADTALARFLSATGQNDYWSLWRWSIAHKDVFWSKLWDFCGVIGDKGEIAFQSGDRFQDARFFPQGELNFAENLLRRKDPGSALIFRSENGSEETLSFQDLYAKIARVQQALRKVGVVAGDRVAGWLPNRPETVIAMLATASLGAIWSSASPDFGVQGVLDRFGQITPKVLFAVDGYFYNGKSIDCRAKVQEAVSQLPSVQKTVMVSYLGLDIADPAVSFDNWIQECSADIVDFPRFPFSHPLFILFSSGTTGVPKCIVHGAGGTLLQLLKELRLHCNVGRDDRVFYFTTCGWMMWNWLMAGLAAEATLMLYDGAPLFPTADTLFRYAEQHGCTLFGTSAKYIDAVRAAGVRLDKGALPTVRLMTSTGSPLSPENFDYVYEAIAPHVQLASISGGTDIVSCFVLGNPALPVHRGEIQGPGLGMDVDVFDAEGHPLPAGKGELVCKTPFPSMPVRFWNDPDGKKYQAAYFSRFPGVWCHGDWCEWTQHQGLIIYGRSDATLNPGGVRIGTAEIYRVVETLPEVRESLAVAQEWDGDVRIILFVVPQAGCTIDEYRIKAALRDKASPRHVPARIVTVSDIPRTKSGKITELAVREVIHGRAVKNKEALANPEALDLYKNLPELNA